MDDKTNTNTKPSDKIDLNIDPKLTTPAPPVTPLATSTDTPSDLPPLIPSPSVTSDPVTAKTPPTLDKAPESESESAETPTPTKRPPTLDKAPESEKPASPLAEDPDKVTPSGL